MEVAATQQFTLHLSRGVMEQLKQAAQERHETPDTIIEEALVLALSPVRQQAMQRLKQQIRQQQSLAEPQIRARLDAALHTEEEKRLSQLLEQSKLGDLTQEEQAERQRLFDRIEAIATEKAAALWLLSGKPPEPDAMP